MPVAIAKLKRKYLFFKLNDGRNGRMVDVKLPCNFFPVCLTEIF